MNAIGSFFGEKRLGLEADLSTPPSGEVKNGGALPPIPDTYSWRGAQLIKPTDHVTFLITS
jgi:hypothetical protein